MMEDLLATYTVKNEDGIYVITGQPKTDLLSKFLARNPNDDELFLLFGNQEDYILLKGDVERGLRVCRSEKCVPLKDCLAFKFSLDNFLGIITVPQPFQHQKPSYWPNQTPVQLETELFEIIKIVR